MARRISEEQQNEAFRKFESVPFPAEIFERVMPQQVARWRLIGDLKSVPWQWVLACELALTAFLSPTAVLLPEPEIAIFAVIWFMFVHPGSTNTSGIISFYGDFLDEIELKANDDRLAAWKARGHEELPSAAGAPAPLQHGVARVDNRRRGSAGGARPEPLEFVQGTGSVEGLGIMASATQNLGMGVGFQVEGSLFLRWLLSESLVNQSIVTTLFERFRWKRTTVDGKKSFSIYYPFIVVAGALHLNDIWDLFTGDDDLGLRSRLTFFFSRPSFKRRHELHAASTHLQAANPEWKKNLFNAFYKIFQAHHPDFSPGHHFRISKTYPFRVYTLKQGDADARFTATFNHHVEQQELSYLSSHEEFKTHGKKKTKSLRWALLFLILQTGMSPESTVTSWPTTVDAASMEAGEAWVTYCDAVSDAISEIYAHLQEVKENPARAVASSTSNAHAHLTATLAAPLHQWEVLAQPARQAAYKILLVVVRMNKVWIQSSTLRNCLAVREEFGEQADTPESYAILCTACGLLAYFGLASLALSTNASGPKFLLLVKKPFNGVDAHIAGVLHILSVPQEEFKTPSAADLAKGQPKNTKAPVFPTLADEESATRRAKLQAIVAEVTAPLAAPGQ